MLTENCKSKKKDVEVQKENTNNGSSVTINSDAELKSSVDAITKNYPDVKADIDNGVVTLKGSIRQDELQTLIMKVQELRPKKVENKLDIK